MSATVAIATCVASGGVVAGAAAKSITLEAPTWILDFALQVEGSTAVAGRSCSQQQAPCALASALA